MLHYWTKWRTKRLIGIDIRQNFLRLVELTYHNNTYQLNNCINLVLPTPPHTDSAIIAALKTLLQQVTIHTRNIALALSHSLALTHEYQLDTTLSTSAINKFITHKLTEHFLSPAQQFSFAYQVFPATTPHDTHNNSIQVVAAHRMHLDRWKNLLLNLNLRLQIIDVDLYALERAIRWQLQQQNIEGLSVLINIDNLHLLMLALDKTQLIYQHEDYLASSRLTTPTHILAIITTKLHLCATALNRTVDQLILGGNITNSPGLLEFIGAKLQIPVMRASCWDGIKCAPSLNSTFTAQLAPLMLISCGLALRAATTKNNNAPY